MARVKVVPEHLVDLLECFVYWLPAPFRRGDEMSLTEIYRVMRKAPTINERS
jgi:hypothetical protein